jgi:hypothetical protein
LRPEGATDVVAEAAPAAPPKIEKAGAEKAAEPAADYPRVTGNAALVRRASALI